MKCRPAAREQWQAEGRKGYWAAWGDVLSVLEVAGETFSRNQHQDLPHWQSLSDAPGNPFLSPVTADTQRGILAEYRKSDQRAL